VTIAVAATIAIAHPLFAPGALVVAAVVAYSRVALRVHHVSDTVAGAALGLGGAIAADYLLR
jgi:membrane-associated phospholipid phosphatase